MPDVEYDAWLDSLPSLTEKLPSLPDKVAYSTLIEASNSVYDNLLKLSALGYVQLGIAPTELELSAVLLGTSAGDYQNRSYLHTATAQERYIEGWLAVGIRLWVHVPKRGAKTYWSVGSRHSHAADSGMEQ
jgi:hypothetical protein